MLNDSKAVISLLIPAYRASELQRTLESVWKTVRDDEKLEIVVHSVLGDEKTAKLLGNWVHKSISSDRTGWETLPVTFNALAKVSSGDWLFQIGDDTSCHTYGWDEIIRRYDHTVPALLTPRETHYESMMETFGPNRFELFPIISRKAYEKMGCLTRSLYHDAWLHEVFERAGIDEAKRIPAYFTNRIFSNESYGRLEKEPPEAQQEFWRTVDEAAAQLRGGESDFKGGDPTTERLHATDDRGPDAIGRDPGADGVVPAANDQDARGLPDPV